MRETAVVESLWLCVYLKVSAHLAYPQIQKNVLIRDLPCGPVVMLVFCPVYSSLIVHLNSQLHSPAHGPCQVLPGLHFPAQLSGNGLQAIICAIVRNLSFVFTFSGIALPNVQYLKTVVSQALSGFLGKAKSYPYFYCFVRFQTHSMRPPSP